MAIKKVWLDETDDECTSCGLCEGIAPEVFEVPDKMIVKEGINFGDYEDEIRESAESCPTEVIKIMEE